MSEYSRRIVPIVVVTLIVTTLVAYEVNNIDSASPQTSQIVQGSALGSDGLQLSVSMRVSQLVSGQILQVNVSVLNTFSTTNILPVSNGFPFQGVPLGLWPDCDEMVLGSPSVGFNTSAPAEAVVLKGNYEINNITSVADVNVPVNGCTLGMKVEQVTFGPDSAQANLTVSYADPLAGNATVGPYDVAGMFTANGYWRVGEFGFLNYEGQQTIDSPVTSPFTPGTYTVGIEDVWGQAVILHFVVK